jgi:hypothetical protein
MTSVTLKRPRWATGMIRDVVLDDAAIEVPAMRATASAKNVRRALAELLQGAKGDAAHGVGVRQGEVDADVLSGLLSSDQLRGAPSEGR